MTAPIADQAQCPSGESRRAGRSFTGTIDAAVTAVLFAALLILAIAAFAYSLLFAMVTDSCGPDNCRDGYLVAGYAVTWGGIAASVAGTVVGVVAAARRRDATWTVPLLGALTVVLSFVFGLGLAESAAP